MPVGPWHPQPPASTRPHPLYPAEERFGGRGETVAVPSQHLTALAKCFAACCQVSATALSCASGTQLFHPATSQHQAAFAIPFRRAAMWPAFQHFPSALLLCLLFAACCLLPGVCYCSELREYKQTNKQTTKKELLQNKVFCKNQA